jgi:arginine decarboxylase
MESIMAVAHSNRGERATAGLIYGWLYDRFSQRKHGGLVCEHNGGYARDEIELKLRASIEELYVNGFSDQYELRDTTAVIESFVPDKTYGTALVALCFTSYVFPKLSPP